MIDLAVALTIIGITLNIVALIDYTSKIISQIRDFSGKLKALLNVIQHLENILPILDVTLKTSQSRIAAARVDDKESTALLPLLKDCQTQLEELKIISKKTLPNNNDNWFEILWKIITSLQKAKKVDEISVAVDRYVGVLTMQFSEAAAHPSRDLLSISTLIPTRVSRGLDEPWEQKPIYLTIMGMRYTMPFISCQTVQVRERVEWLIFDKLLIVLLCTTGFSYFPNVCLSGL